MKEIERVRKWLEYAELDLAAARRLASRDDTLLDYAAVHCQQAAEKALKAVIVYGGHRPPLTHDIEKLIEKAGGTGVDRNINSNVPLRCLLTNFAIAPRYPEPEFTHLKREDFDKVLDNAREFYGYIDLMLLSKIMPAEATKKVQPL